MSYSHLTERERVAIFYLDQMGLSHRQIGQKLGRHHTTIGREIKRNTIAFSRYWYGVAHGLAVARRKQGHHFRRLSHVPLLTYVLTALKQDWSPQIIAERVRMTHPRNASMRVSAETIYRWVYRDTVEGGQLYQHLLRRHKKRRRQKRYGTGWGRLVNRVGIEFRPAGAQNRSRYGHWEGDTVEGKKGTGGAATHVERKSRLLIATKLENGTAKEMAQKTSTLFQRIPERWRRTLTVDNGKEFARFETIEERTGMDVYFSKPYSPWERGSNEQVNGLLRFYFPKGCDWTKVSDDQLEYAVNRINNRPRKCLGYRTPLEVYSKSIGGALGM